MDSANINNHSYGPGNAESTSISNGRVPIADLQPNVQNVIIIGLIITKQSPKNVPSKRDPGKEQYLMSFTIRDSIEYMINATCWGDEQHINELAELLHIGDVVEIKNAQIQSRPGDFIEERYRPMSTSKYQLNISQNHSSVLPYCGDASKFWHLNHIPTKASNDFYPLADIVYNGDHLHNEHVNILVVIKSIGRVRDIVTKQGRHVNKLELRVFDETSMNFTINLWEDEQISVAKNWTPCKSVVFMADVKMFYDTFRKCMAGSGSSKTVFTVNPNTNEAQSLNNYANLKRRELEEDDYSEQDITDVFTIDELKKKLYDRSSHSIFYGITYAYITCLDIDGTTNVIRKRCEICKIELSNYNGQCINPECLVGLGAELPQNEAYLQIRVSLSDHTGSVHSCQISGLAAEISLRCSCDDFRTMKIDHKTNLKWEFLLERCKVIFKGMTSTLESEKPLMKILNFCLANADEYIQKLQSVQK